MVNLLSKGQGGQIEGSTLKCQMVKGGDWYIPGKVSLRQTT